MKKTICSVCGSDNIEMINDEYQGEYTALTYNCLDCNKKTTDYYDIIFNPFTTFLASTTQKETT